MPSAVNDFEIEPMLKSVKDGNIVLEKGYGFRDLAAVAPITTATLFNIGSISKSFTALGIAQLVDQHQVDLDTPVIRYIPDFRLSDPQAAEAVTLRQLLSHTSGLPADEQWPQQVPATRPAIVTEFASMPDHRAAGNTISVLQPMHCTRGVCSRTDHGPILGGLHADTNLCGARDDHGLIRASRAGASDRSSPTVSS